MGLVKASFGLEFRPNKRRSLFLLGYFLCACPFRYIHPVIPVLNETRVIVTKYNAILRSAVESCSFGLKWLDFFGDLLTPDGEALCKDLELDGTHLSPVYVKHLEKALKRHLEA